MTESESHRWTTQDQEDPAASSSYVQLHYSSRYDNVDTESSRISQRGRGLGDAEEHGRSIGQRRLKQIAILLLLLYVRATTPHRRARKRVYNGVTEERKKIPTGEMEDGKTDDIWLSSSHLFGAAVAATVASTASTVAAASATTTTIERAPPRTEESLSTDDYDTIMTTAVSSATEAREEG